VAPAVLSIVFCFKFSARRPCERANMNSRDLIKKWLLLAGARVCSKRRDGEVWKIRNEWLAAIKTSYFLIAVRLFSMQQEGAAARAGASVGVILWSAVGFFENRRKQDTGSGVKRHGMAWPAATLTF
jgi:hypothetical protein